MCRLQDAAELLVRRTDHDPGKGKGRVGVSAMAWDREGKRLLFGTENGEAGLLTLPI